MNRIGGLTENPITRLKKLESILPFLEQNYSQVVDIVKNDIKYIKDNQIDY